MWLDVVALGILAAFALMGALRGGLVAGLALASLGVGYGAAIWAAPRYGALASELTGVPGWLGMPIAGSAAFLLAFLVMGVVSFAARHAWALEPGEKRSPRDRFLGASFGAARGALVVLLLSYLALWVDALRVTGTAPDLPEVGSSAATRVTQRVVEAGMGAMVDGDQATGKLVARIAARPGQSIVEMQALMEHPVIQELRSDEMFWTYVEAGSVDAALARRGAVALVYDGGMRQRLGELGLIDADAVADSAAFREQAAQVLRQVGPRIRGLKNDPELQALMQDPAIVEAVQSGNHVALLGHPGFRAVVARVMETPPAH